MSENTIISKRDKQENPAEWNKHYFNQSSPGANILYNIRLRVLHLHSWRNNVLLTESIDEALRTVEELQMKVNA